MRVLVVLALVAFTGCNANIFYADEPKPQMEVLTDAVRDYVSKADDTVQMLKKSQFGQQVNEHLVGAAETANKYVQTVQDQLPQLAQDIVSTFTNKTSDLRVQLEQELDTFKEKLVPFTEDMKVKIEERVEKLKEEMASYGDSLDSDAWRTTLLQMKEELKLSLEQNVRDLQTELEPLKYRTEQFQMRLTQIVQQIRDSAAPYVGEIREKIGATELENHLSALYNALFKTE